MKKLIAILTISLLVLTSSIAGEKAELKWRSFDAKTLAEAKKKDKKFLVDVYTTWCRWCKRLDEDVYGNEKIAAYIGEKYIAVKINAESDAKINYKDTVLSEMGFARAFGVTGYPTILFLEPDGDAITSLGGYVPAERFLPIAKFIGEDHYKKMSWQDYLNKQSSPEGTKKEIKK